MSSLLELCHCLEKHSPINVTTGLDLRTIDFIDPDCRSRAFGNSYHFNNVEHMRVRNERDRVFTYDYMYSIGCPIFLHMHGYKNRQNIFGFMSFFKEVIFNHELLKHLKLQGSIIIPVPLSDNDVFHVFFQNTVAEYFFVQKVFQTTDLPIYISQVDRRSPPYAFIVLTKKTNKTRGIEFAIDLNVLKYDKLIENDTDLHRSQRQRFRSLRNR